VLVGFRDAEQLHTTVTSLGNPLPPEEITELRAVLHPTTVTV
jgi:aryl-alcohol dehydrogenase-like predicted oxidoreductase